MTAKAICTRTRLAVCALAALWLGASLVVAAGTAAETLVPVPESYQEVFRSDFSNTTPAPDSFGGNQW